MTPSSNVSHRQRSPQGIVTAGDRISVRDRGLPAESLSITRSLSMHPGGTSVPTYAYACKDCGHAFDIQQTFSEDSLSVCPECRGTLRKKFNSVGVVFKGSGFYRTDSRSTSSSVPAAASATTGSSAGSAGSESASSGSASAPSSPSKTPVAASSGSSTS